MRVLPFKMRDFSNGVHREKKLSFGHLKSPAPYVKAIILNNLFASRPPWTVLGSLFPRSIRKMNDESLGRK